MTTALASSSSPKKANGGGVAKLPPELLMAARQGESELLNKLLNHQDAVVIDIKRPAASSNGNEETAAAPPDIGLALDSVLHVVASSGDGDAFLKSADVICAKARHLLGARDGNGDTPLQCAARAGNTRMASHLLVLARSGVRGGSARLVEMLRNQNEQGETALHDALRLADKEKVRLMATDLLEFSADKNDDAGFAHIESFNGTSPMYLAVMLGHDGIAEKLYKTAEKGQRQLSYSGPGGQNALHAAVLRSYGMTKKLLNWNKGLTKQRDQTTGSTPLHMAATWEEADKRVIELLLDTDRSSAFLSDGEGSFPIHAAAARMCYPVARLILDKCPGCAVLRDGQGKTFLHIAVEKGRPLVAGFACLQRRFAPILNVRDNDGNTALHLAVEVGDLWSFYSLIQNPSVQLDLANNEGQTPMDTAEKRKPDGIVYVLDPRMRIHVLLRGAGAKNGIFRCDWLREDHAAKKHIFYEDYERSISDSTQFIGIGSVLIVTMAFAAAFTLPGSFLGADRYGEEGPCTLHGGVHHEHCAGKATLAYDGAFRVFIVANTLALVCSGLSTMHVMFAGVVVVDIRRRLFNFSMSVAFLYCSAKCLGVAFICGLFAMLPEDALAVAYVSVAIGSPLLILDLLWFGSMFAIGELMLLRRLGWARWFQSLQFRRTVLAGPFRALVMPLPRRKSDEPRTK